MEPPLLMIGRLLFFMYFAGFEGSSLAEEVGRLLKGEADWLNWIDWSERVDMPTSFNLKIMYSRKSV